jgi:hypothetical protein
MHASISDNSISAFIDSSIYRTNSGEKRLASNKNTPTVWQRPNAKIMARSIVSRHVKSMCSVAFNGMERVIFPALSMPPCGPRPIKIRIIHNQDYKLQKQWN